MSPRDFFRVVLKILAILMIVNGVVPAFSQLITYFGRETYIALLLLGMAIFFGFIAWVILIKTDEIIEVLKLDRGYQTEEFTFGEPHTGKIIRLACIIAGLYMFFESVPDILVEFLMYLRLDVSESLYVDFNMNSEYFLLKGVFKMVFGLILILSRHRIARLFSSNK